jgi:hypothetical protein
MISWRKMYESMTRRTVEGGHSMLCPTENFCGELSADINADSSRKIRYKIKEKGGARMACLHSFGKYAAAFAREGGESTEVEKEKEEG